MSNHDPVRDFFAAIRHLSTEKQARAIAWMHAVHDGDDMDQGLLAMVLRGDMLLDFDEQGEPRFKLTEQGRGLASRLILESETAAAMWETINGPASKTPQ